MGDRLGRGRAYTCSRTGTGKRARRHRRRRSVARAAPAAAPIVYGSVGHAIPDARDRHAGRAQGPPGPGDANRARGDGLPRQLLLTLCAVISVFVLGLLLWVIFRYRRGANPTPSRNSHNTVIEVVWTLVPVLILVGIAIPSIRLLRHQYTPAAGRRDGQDHRPPMVLVVRISRQRRDVRQQYPQGKGRPDAAGDRYRTDDDGPPLLAADERMVIPEARW